MTTRDRTRAQLEDTLNEAAATLRTLRAGFNELQVIYSGGEVPTEDKTRAFTLLSLDLIKDAQKVYQHARGLWEESCVHYAPEPSAEDIEHDIAEQRWEEERDLSAVHE